ncbi:helix-turn-helix domain-containing protein [Brevundimonas sp. GN22]
MLSKAQQAEALKLRSKGESLGVVAKRFGVSRSAIQRIEKSLPLSEMDD